MVCCVEHGQSKKDNYIRLCVSARDADEINHILGTYTLIEEKLKRSKKIKILDVGCGKNGNGIATLAAKYPERINGFGIDVDIQQHPSNVIVQLCLYNPE